MSDISLLEKNQGFSIHVEDIGSEPIERAAERLAGIEGGLKKALYSAASRAATSGEAYAARAVRAEYFVSASDFKEYTKSKQHIRSDESGTEVSIEFAGKHIPLIRFNSSFTGNGRISVRVMRSSVRTTLDNAFVKTTKSGHTNIFERETSSRTPLRQFFGPATTQMMYSNKAVTDAVDEKVRETFEKRLDHEVERLLNGWGK